MITTAILPAVGVSFALLMGRKRISYYWHLLIYAPAAFFIVMFALIEPYRAGAVCQAIFIQYPTAGLLGDFYGTYYIIYVLGSATLFYFFSSRRR